MAISVFPAPTSAGNIAKTVTATAANTLYVSNQTFDTGTYTISCSSSVVATVYFYSGNTLLATAVTSSGTIAVNLGTAANKIGFFVNSSSNVPISILLTGNPVSSTSGILDTITTTTANYSYNGTAFVVAVGAGGGGGGGNFGAAGGGGGGSGGIAAGMLTLTSPTTITIGASGGASNGNNNVGGSSGGTTTISNLTANGGGGGSATVNGNNGGGGSGGTGNGNGGAGGNGGSGPAGSGNVSITSPYAFAVSGTTGGGSGGSNNSGTLATPVGSGIGTGGGTGTGGSGYGFGGRGGGWNNNATSGGEGVVYIVRV